MLMARTFFALLVWQTLLLGAVAQPAPVEVEVALFAVPEATWQARYEGKFAEHPALWLRLHGDAVAGQVIQPVDFKFRLVEGEPITQRRGSEQEFVEGWRTWHSPGSEAVPDRKTRRFVGTSVELTQQATSEPGPLSVTMNFEHHLAEPTMHRINYANAATGAERDRLSVKYPNFETVEWRGELFVSREWRLATNLLRPQPAGSVVVPATRYLLFIKRA